MTIDAQNEPRKWRLAPQLGEARRNRGLSQAGLTHKLSEAGLAYFKNTHTSRLECGYLDATWREVEAIATALEVAPEWLAKTTKRVEVPRAVPLSAPDSSKTLAFLAEKKASPNAIAPAPSTSAASTTPAATEPPPAPAPPAHPLPDFTLLEQGDRSIDTYRQTLVNALAEAHKMLHLSGLPASPWRQWREFDRKARETLRQVPV